VLLFSIYKKLKTNYLFKCTLCSNGAVEYKFKWLLKADLVENHTHNYMLSFVIFNLHNPDILISPY